MCDWSTADGCPLLPTLLSLSTAGEARVLVHVWPCSDRTNSSRSCGETAVSLVPDMFSDNLADSVQVSSLVRHTILHPTLQVFLCLPEDGPCPKIS